MSSVSSTSSAGLTVSNETLEFGSKYQILECHQKEYAERFLQVICKGAREIVAWYVADGIIGNRERWLFHWGVDIGPETDRIKQALEFDRFYPFYHGPNPVDVFENMMKKEGEPERVVRQVCETCLIPTIVPKSVTTNIIGIKLEHNFNLHLLGDIAEHPEHGYAAKYAYASDALEQHGRTEVDEARLVVQLKGVVARNKSWPEQVEYLKELKALTGYECEEEPEILPQATVVMFHHAVTGERPLGTDTGVEGRWTYARTAELVNNTYHVVSGGFSAGIICPLGGAAPAELSVYSNGFAREIFGVAVRRKF